MDYDYRKAAEELQKLTLERHRGGAMEKYGLAIRGEMFALNFLYRHGSTVLPSEISEKMGISTARIASILNALEGKELITRRIDPTDRRKILVELTEEGGARAVAHREEMLQGAERVLRKMGEDDTRELLRLLGKLFDVMKEG